MYDQSELRMASERRVRELESQLSTGTCSKHDDDCHGRAVQAEAERDAAIAERDDALADITIPWRERDAQKFGALEAALSTAREALEQIAGSYSVTVEELQDRAAAALESIEETG